jgi:hypothetical protein
VQSNLQAEGLEQSACEMGITVMVKSSAYSFVVCGFAEIFYEHWRSDYCPPYQIRPFLINYFLY